MTQPSPDPIVERLSKDVRKEQSLVALMQGKKGFGSLSDVGFLQSGPGRDVYLARRNDTPVVIKHLTHPDAETQTRAIRNETDVIRPVLGRKYRLAKCIAARPKSGLLLFEHLPGAPLRHVLHGASLSERAGIMTEAADWADRYASARNRKSDFGPWFWVKTRAADDLSGMSAPDQALVRRVLERMRDLARTHAGRPVKQAAVHWDFCPQNFNWHKGRLMGFDNGPECWMAQSRSIAHFMVAALCVGDQFPMDPCGVRACDLEAMAPVVPKSERKGILPFFIAERLVDRFVRRTGTVEDTKRLRAAMRACSIG